MTHRLFPPAGFLTMQVECSNPAVIHAKLPWVPPAPSEMPATVAIQGPSPEAVAGTIVAPKKDAVWQRRR
jgi:hypothetical protein